MTIYGCGCIDEFLIKPSNFFFVRLWFGTIAMLIRALFARLQIIDLSISVSFVLGSKSKERNKFLFSTPLFFVLSLLSNNLLLSLFHSHAFLKSYAFQEPPAFSKASPAKPWMIGIAVSTPGISAWSTITQEESSSAWKATLWFWSVSTILHWTLRVRLTE